VLRLLARAVPAAVSTLSRAIVRSMDRLAHRDRAADDADDDGPGSNRIAISNRNSPLLTLVAVKSNPGRMRFRWMLGFPIIAALGAIIVARPVEKGWFR